MMMAVSVTTGGVTTIFPTRTVVTSLSNWAPWMTSVLEGRMGWPAPVLGMTRVITGWLKVET